MPAWMTSLFRELVPLPMQSVEFQQDHVAAGRRQLAGDRKPDHAGPDHHAVHPFQGLVRLCIAHHHLTDR